MFLKSDILILVLIILLSVFLLSAMALIAYLFRVIKIRIRLKAKTFSQFVPYSEKGNIVFVGDSLTEFYNTDEFFHPLNPYNRGIASDTTDGVIARLQDNVISLEPRKVFLQIGTNDLASKKTCAIERVFSNIQAILETMLKMLPKTKLYLISLYPVNPKAKTFSWIFTGRRKNADIRELNRLLKQYCDEAGITYIDAYSVLADVSGNLKKEYTVEGLHISFRGYQEITDLLMPYLRES